MDEEQQEKKKNKINYYIVAGVIGVIVVIFAVIMLNQNKGPNYDGFARCLAASGAKMYGAWWCPHCKAQEEAFGKSWEIFKTEGGYVECSTQDRQQTQPCIDAGIPGYPTWKFPGQNKTVSGQQPFELLAQYSGCSLN
jgi:hypothetical protein